MELPPVKHLVHGILGALALSALVTACGGDTSGDRSIPGMGGMGFGGSGPIGGSGGGSGGSAGMAGAAAGTAGTGGTPATGCSAPLAPATGYVTDFSDYDSASGKWGKVGGLRGPTYGYQGDDAAHTGDPSKTEQKIDASAGDYYFKSTVQPAGYGGCGLQFDSCATVAAYKGVSFSLSGTYPGCSLEFQLAVYSQKDQKDGGGCTSSCYNYPKTAAIPEPTAGKTTVKVLFSELTGWMDSYANEVVGLQFQFSATGSSVCQGEVRIDDVTLVTE